MSNTLRAENSFGVQQAARQRNTEQEITFDVPMAENRLPGGGEAEATLPRSTSAMSSSSNASPKPRSSGRPLGLEDMLPPQKKSTRKTKISICGQRPNAPKESSIMPEITGPISEHQQSMMSEKATAVREKKSQFFQSGFISEEDFAAGTAFTQLDFWNPQFQFGGLDQSHTHSKGLPLNLTAGELFNDVPELHCMPCEVVADVNSHPDSMLRACGLVLQSGTLPHGLPFDPVTWVRFDEREGVWKTILKEHHIGPDKEKQVADRKDFVPSGIINVVGTLNVSRFLTKEEDARLRKQKREDSNALKAAKSGGGAGGKSSAALTVNSSGGVSLSFQSTTNNFSLDVMAGTVTSSMDALQEPAFDDDGYEFRDYDDDDREPQALIDFGDPDSTFLAKHESLKYIKHYLTRGVIKAAKAADACILASGTDDVSRQLGIGHSAIVDPLAIKERQTTRVKTLLVGVNPLCDEHKIDLNFTHHFLLTARRHDFDARGTCFHCKRRSADVDPDGTCDLNPSYGLEGHYEATDKPSQAELLKFKLALLDALHNGYNPDGSARIQPPIRKKVPVVVVLFGGDSMAMEECRRAVSRGWPILVIEGSGGYADVICGTKKKVLSLRPDATADEFRTLLSGVDAATCEIINNGNHTIIDRGTDVMAFERVLASSLKGDEILIEAWKLYALFKLNQENWFYQNQVMQISIFVLSLSATLASVMQTFFILYHSSVRDKDGVTVQWLRGEIRSSERYWFMVYTMLQWLVIGLPIFLTLLHAVSLRYNPWAKLAALRIATHGVLKEIYMYRTRTRGYSDEVIKRNQRLQKKQETGADDAAAAAAVAAVTAQPAVDGVGPANAGGAVEDTELLDTSYTSRGELLGIRLCAVVTRLGLSDVRRCTLILPTSNIVPPQDILDGGDAGLNTMTPDEYVRVRTSIARDELNSRAAHTDSHFVGLSVSVFFFGLFSTIFAAMSAFGLGYLQPWVSFSTAMVNSTSRFIDVSRVKSITEISNTASLRLADIERWWTSLGSEADSVKNREKLVTETERILQEELEGWSRQVGSYGESLVLDDDTAEADPAAAVEAKKQQALLEVGAEALTPEAALQAMLDPSSQEAAKLKKQLLDVNDKLGIVIRVVENKVEEVGSVAAAASHQMADSAAGTMSALMAAQGSMTEQASAAAAAAVATAAAAAAAACLSPAEQAANSRLLAAQMLVSDPKIRKQFFSLFTAKGLFDRRIIEPTTLMKAMCIALPSAQEQLVQMTPMELLTLGKLFVVKNIVEDIKQLVRADAPVGSTDARFDIPMELAMDFVSAFAAITNIFIRVDLLNRAALCLVLDQQDVKQCVLSLSAEKVTLAVRRLVHYFVPGQDLTRIRRDSSINPQTSAAERARELHPYEQYMLLRSLCAAHAATEASSNTSTRQHQMHLELSRVAEAMSHIVFPVEKLSKVLLLGLKGIPKAIREQWAERSSIEIVEQMRIAAAGSASGRAFAKCRRSFFQLGILQSDDILVTDCVTSAKFVLAMECLSQQVINKEEKGGIIRAMQSAPTMTEDISKKLKGELPEKELKTLLGWLQATQSNSFCGTLIQRLSDSFAMVDLRSLLAVDQLEQLIVSVTSVPPAFAIESMSRKELESMCGPPIARELSALADDHLRECFTHMRHLADFTYPQSVWAQVNTSVLAKYMDRISTLVIQRLVFAAQHMTEYDVANLLDCKHVSEITAIIGDPVVSVALTGMCQDPNDVDLATGITDIIGDLHGVAHDSLLIRMWHRFMAVADPEMLPLHQAMLRSYCGPSGSKNPQVFLNLVKATWNEIDAVQSIDRLAEFLNISRKEIDAGGKLYACVVSSVGRRFEAVHRTLIEAKIFFDMELSYCIFEEICQGCIDFDLRDIVVDAVDRRVLAIGLHALNLRKDHQFFVAGSMEQGGKSMVTKQEILTYLIDAVDQVELDSTSKVYPYFFGNVSEAVRLCLTDQVHLLLAVAGEVMHTDAGQVFGQQCITHIHDTTKTRLDSTISATSSKMAFESEAEMESVVMIIASKLVQFVRPGDDEIIKVLLRLHARNELPEMQCDALLRLVPDEQIVREAVSLHILEKKQLHRSIDVYYRMITNAAKRRVNKSNSTIVSFQDSFGAMTDDPARAFGGAARDSDDLDEQLYDEESDGEEDLQTKSSATPARPAGPSKQQEAGGDDEMTLESPPAAAAAQPPRAPGELEPPTYDDGTEEDYVEPDD